MEELLKPIDERLERAFARAKCVEMIDLMQRINDGYSQENKDDLLKLLDVFLGRNYPLIVGVEPGATWPNDRVTQVTLHYSNVPMLRILKKHGVDFLSKDFGFAHYNLKYILSHIDSDEDRKFLLDEYKSRGHTTNIDDVFECTYYDHSLATHQLDNTGKIIECVVAAGFSIMSEESHLLNLLAPYNRTKEWKEKTKKWTALLRSTIKTPASIAKKGKSSTK